MVILVLNIVRACHQSVTYDEATTYNYFVASGPIRIWLSFGSANHTFHSLLVWMSTRILGLSHISLRLPALMGGALYLIVCERLCRIVSKDLIGYCLALLSLTVSPFILDYIIVARGYSLALGFLMAALLACYLEITFKNEEKRKLFLLRFAGISCLCALSVASNLAFAFVNIALLSVLIVWSILGRWVGGEQTGMKHCCVGMMTLFFPGAVLYLLINPAIISYTSGTMYHGVKTWGETYRSIVDVLFRDLNSNIIGNNEMFSDILRISMAYNFIFLVVIASLGSIFFHIRRVRKHESTMHPRTVLLVLTAVVLVLTIAFHQVAHTLFQLLLPLRRTGICFVPLVFLVICSSVESMRSNGSAKLLGLAGRWSLCVVVMCFLLSLRMTHFRQFKPNSGAKDVYHFLESLNPVVHERGVGVNWIYRPSLNFYRILYRQRKMPFLTSTNSVDDHLIYVLRPGVSEDDKAIIESRDLKVLYEHHLSGALIVGKRNGSISVE